MEGSKTENAADIVEISKKLNQVILVLNEYSQSMYQKLNLLADVQDLLVDGQNEQPIKPTVSNSN